MTEIGTDQIAAITRRNDLSGRTLQDLVDRKSELSDRAVLAAALGKLVTRGEYDPSRNTPLDDPAAQPLTVAEHLELLAVEESIRRRIMSSRALAIRDALAAGATWSQVAAAVDTDVETAKAMFERWIIGQERLYDSSEQLLIGLDPDQRRAARTLLDRQ